MSRRAIVSLIAAIIPAETMAQEESLQDAFESGLTGIAGKNINGSFGMDFSFTVQRQDSEIRIIYSFVDGWCQANLVRPFTEDDGTTAIYAQEVLGSEGTDYGICQASPSKIALTPSNDGQWAYRWPADDPEGSILGVLAIQQAPTEELTEEERRQKAYDEMMAAAECQEGERASVSVDRETTLNLSAFELVCDKPTHMDPPEWELALVSTEVGADYSLNEDPGSYTRVDSMAKGGYGYYEIEEMLELITQLPAGGGAEISLTDPNSSKSSMDSGYYKRVVLRRGNRNERDNIDVPSGNVIGERLSLFAAGDWYALEEDVENEARRAVDPYLSGENAARARSALVGSRHARLMTVYAIVRMDIHGDCGEATEEVPWSTTTWTEYRDGYGNYKGRSDPATTTEFFDVPLGFRDTFARVGDIEIGPEAYDRMAKAIANLDCRNPDRKAVEQNMIRFFHHDY